MSEQIKFPNNKNGEPLVNQSKSENKEGLSEQDLSSHYLADLDQNIKLEDQMIEELSKTQDNSLRLSLNSLRQVGEASLKKLSETAINLFNSNRLVIKLRNIYVNQRSEQIIKQIEQKSLTEFEDLDSFFKLLKSDFWGDISNKKDAADVVYTPTKALRAIAEAFPEDKYHEQIIDTWASLFNKNNSYSSEFKAYVYKIRVAKFNHLTDVQEKIELMQSSNEFVALDFIENNRILENKEIISVFDSTMLKYSDYKSLPGKYIKSLFNIAYHHPEEMLSDSRRINCLFQLWLSAMNRHDHYDYKYLQNVIPLLANRLKYCSSEESLIIIRKLIDNWSRYNNDFHWLIKMIPLSKEHHKIISQHLKNQPDTLLSSAQDEVLNKNTKDKELAILMEESASSSNAKKLFFLSNLIVNYSNNKLGITEEDVGQVMDNIVKHRHYQKLDFNELHCLSELIDRSNWSNDLMVKLFTINTLDKDHLHTLFTELDNQDYQWIRKNPLLMQQLELAFNKQVDINQLRHYLYDVLDNKYTSKNLDDLIRSYAQRENYFDFEEINNLFTVKKIDKKYIAHFISKIPTRNLINGIDGLSSQADKEWYLESAIKYGQADGLTQIFAKLLDYGSVNNPEKRAQILESFTQNIISKIDLESSDNDIYKIQSINSQIFGDGFLSLLDQAEGIKFGQTTLNSALNFKHNESITLFTLKDAEDILKFFPDDQVRKEYLDKLFNKLIDDNQNSYYPQVLNFYFENSWLLNIIDEASRINLEDKIFSDENLASRTHTLLPLFCCFNDKQKNNFLNNFEKSFKISAYNQDELCSVLAKNAATIHAHDEAALRRIYIHILQDPKLNSMSANRLFREDIVLNDQMIRNAFFNNISRWPEVDGTKILSLMALRKRNHQEGIFIEDFPLNLDEVKLISTATIKNRGLSPKFWNGYLQSDQNDPTFYLDQELFKIGIDNVGDDFLEEKPSEMVDCLKSLSNSQFEFNEQDRQTIIKKIFSCSNTESKLEIFYHYDPEIMEHLITNSLNRAHDTSIYYIALEANLNYTANLNLRLIDYLCKEKFSNSWLDAIIKHFKQNNNLAMIDQLKVDLNQLDEKEITASKLIFLQHDLLTVEECKQLYQATTTLSTDNVRSQILNYIDIISSMLSNQENIDKFELFLDNPQRETIKDLQEISQFIIKYQKENKGRSVVVMLFAKEYLPDRPLETVIERVASGLRKHQEIIDKFSYKNIPPGIRASIGMEYEITSSTAKAYQELTSQTSLREDIARLSQAARIGSGRDAVHEIATTPTDNPYLMLLEMKLLHDIDYIDLNFNRSENYQKGARGFHLTIGGEQGLMVNQETNFLQNVIIGASWAGVQAGETGHKVNGGRGVSLRGRDAESANNIAFFNSKTHSVEFRSLSIDTQETLQRSAVTAFHGAIAIQAFKKCFTNHSVSISEMTNQNLLQNTNEENKQIIAIALLWVNLVREIKQAITHHNESFLEAETIGYLDEQDIWIEPSDFRGKENKSRFESVVNNLDPTLSVTEYVNDCKISTEEFFQSFSLTLSDKLIKINNLFLKSGVNTVNDQGKKTNILKGDHTNAIAMLEHTKLSNERLEDYNKDFLTRTAFDALGERRAGYYNVQGASEKMLTHSIQRSLLNFNNEMEKIIN